MDNDIENRQFQTEGSDRLTIEVYGVADKLGLRLSIHAGNDRNRAAFRESGSGENRFHRFEARGCYIIGLLPISVVFGTSACLHVAQARGMPSLFLAPCCLRDRFVAPGDPRQ